MKQNTPNTRLKTFFEQAYGKKLTDEEMLKYKDRLIKFFSLLIEIDQINKRKSNETKTITVNINVLVQNQSIKAGRDVKGIKQKAR